MSLITCLRVVMKRAIKRRENAECQKCIHWSGLQETGQYGIFKCGQGITCMGHPDDYCDSFTPKSFYLLDEILGLFDD